MAKKFGLWAMLVAVMALAGAARQAAAANPATAEIKIRCSVILSVTLTGSPTNYDFGLVEAASTTYSANAVTVRNDSTGAICKWDLKIDTDTLKDAQSATPWTLGTNPGLNQVAIHALFKTVKPADADFDVNADTLTATAKEYNGTNFSDPDYNTLGYNDDASKILPKTYTDITGGAKSPDRKLWLKLQTPLAVTDTNARTINLVVTAKMSE